MPVPSSLKYKPNFVQMKTLDLKLGSLRSSPMSLSFLPYVKCEEEVNGGRDDSITIGGP